MISKIFIINLEECTERKIHMETQMKENNFKNYKFIKGIDKDSDEVQNMMKTDYIFKYPPCFRCRKNQCKCSNNILIKHQIGNWCSFIHIMKKIINNKIKNLIMICEDDIVFNKNVHYILNNMINEKKFRDYNINIDKPLLIRLEQRGPYEPINQLKFTKKKYMSNACFLVNYHYAIQFFKNLKIIDRTSDMYIQRYIVNKDKSIQHFTVAPGICHQLSSGKNAKIESTIHPKGVNKDDKKRKKEHFKRVNQSNYDILTKKYFDIQILNNGIKNKIINKFKKKTIIGKHNESRFNDNLLDFNNENSNNYKLKIFSTCKYKYLIVDKSKNLLINYLLKNQKNNIENITIDESYINSIKQLYKLYLEENDYEKIILENHGTININNRFVQYNMKNNYDLLNDENKFLLNTFHNLELEELEQKIFTL